MSWSDPCSNCGEHRADCKCSIINNNYKMSKQQETIDRLKQGLEMVNTLLEDCKKEGICLEINLISQEEDVSKHEFYFHCEDKRFFKLKEAYKIEKFK